MYEVADGNAIQKKEIGKWDVHEILFHLGMKISNAKAMKSAYENKGKNVIDI